MTTRPSEPGTTTPGTPEPAPPRVSRRTVLAGAFLGAAGAGVAVPRLAGTDAGTDAPRPAAAGAPQRRGPVAPFTRPLTVPAVLAPTHRSADTDFYRVVQRVGTSEVLPGVATPVFGYEGTFPGPTIESRSGRTTVVTHVNQLPLPTVVHLHGGHTPAESDGHPVDLLLPVDTGAYDRRRAAARRPPPGTPDAMVVPSSSTARGSRSYTYPMQQRASTAWYHDHRMGFTGPMVWQGLAGFHLIRDEEEDRLGLPAGAHELPLMIVDRALDAQGRFTYPSVDPTLTTTPGVSGRAAGGATGDTMVVNGTAWPVAPVDRASYRLRLLNACNSRRLSLRLDPPPPGGFTQIGSDGGLLAAPVQQDHLDLAPAQRFDVVVDFTGYAPGTAVTLVNDLDRGAMGQVLRFVVGSRQERRWTAPDTLSSLERYAEADASQHRSFQFRVGDYTGARGWLIDGRAYDPAVVSASPRLGELEVWDLSADFDHPVHLHLDPFQVLARDGRGPGPFDAGWKDTIDLRAGERARIAVRFTDYRGDYVFHCHNLEHEDMGMMATFRTT